MFWHFFCNFVTAEIKYEKIMVMENKQIIGKNLAFFRQKFGLSQEVLADSIEVNNRELLSFYENGQRDIPIEILEKCATLFGVRLSDFLSSDPADVEEVAFFAFRASECSGSDLKAVEEFRRIIRNHCKMNKVAKNVQ